MMKYMLFLQGEPRLHSNRTEALVSKDATYPAYVVGAPSH